MVPAGIWGTVPSVVWREPRLLQSREHHEYAHHQREYHEYLQQQLHQSSSELAGTGRPRRWNRTSSDRRWWRRVRSAQQHTLREHEITKRLYGGFAADADEFAECVAECVASFAQPDEPDDSGPLAGHEADHDYAAWRKRRNESSSASSAQLRAASGQPRFDGIGRTRQCKRKCWLRNRLATSLEWLSAAAEWSDEHSTSCWTDEQCRRAEADGQQCQWATSDRNAESWSCVACCEQQHAECGTRSNVSEYWSVVPLGSASAERQRLWPWIEYRWNAVQE